MVSKNYFEPITIFKQIADIPIVHWNAVVSSKQTYLTLPYLAALESSLPDTIEPLYCIIFDAQQRPLVVGVFQIATFTYKKVTQPNLFLKLFQESRNEDGSFSIKGLVCGNIFATGENGYAYSSQLTKRAAIELMATVATLIKNDERFSEKFSVCLFKEFFKNSIASAEILEDFKYRAFQADDTMVLQLDPTWNTFDDYLLDMKAKYRTKANSALRKSANLEIKSLTYKEIQQHENRMLVLYRNVLDHSNYQYGEQYPKAFAMLKKTLETTFICKGIFLENKLIAFSTAFVNNQCLEANYVGFDYAYNAQYAVYECLLYDYVREAIAMQLSELQLGRTSELIKSALGAQPQRVTLYAKHTSKLKNILLKPLLEGISPSPYELRKPFKKTFYATP